jgi:uncharacterized membrane protein YebE (DUF533 family)
MSVFGPTPPDRLLEKAAAQMERRGRTIGKLQDDDGGVCVLGALGMAAHNDAWHQSKQTDAAAELMVEHGVTGGKAPWQFNDSTRDDRKVVRAMRDAAKAERMTQAEERLTDEMRGMWATPGEKEAEKELVEAKPRAANDPLGVGTGPW